MQFWNNKKKRPFLVTLVIFLITIGLYSFNLLDDYHRSVERQSHRRIITTNDAFPNTFIPYLLLKHKTFSFDPIMDAVRLTQDTFKMPYYLVDVNGSYFSKYPIFTGIMAIPIYAIPVLLNKIPGFAFHDNVIKVMFLGRVAASFYAAGSVALFYLLLETVSKLREEKSSLLWRLIFTFFYAFGTTTFSISSRSLWQHTTAQFLITAVLILLFSGVKKSNLIKWCGLLLGMAVLSRPSVIFLAVIVSLYVFIYYRKELLNFVLFTIPSIAFLLAYNYFVFRNPLNEGYQTAGDTNFSSNVFEGIAGLLASPTRGILFISPPLLFGVTYIIKVVKEKFKKFSDQAAAETRKYDLLMFTLVISLIMQFILIGSWWCWWGADSFGYRLLTEFLPIMGLFAYEATKKLDLKAKAVIFVLMIYSVFVNLNSVMFYISRCEALNNWSFECLYPGREFVDTLQKQL